MNIETVHDSMEDLELPLKGLPATHVRVFRLVRLEDESGISGVGLVAEGAEFSSGWCALVWLTPMSSMGFYPSIKALEAVHGHGGKTKIIWQDQC